MKGLEVEGGAVPLPRAVPAGQPDPLADLVRRRLAGPAQVPVDLVAAVLGVGDRPGQQELEPEFAGPALALVETGADRDQQLEVHADVDDHPGRAEKLRVEQTEQLAVAAQVTKL